MSAVVALEVEKQRAMNFDARRKRSNEQTKKKPQWK